MPALHTEAAAATPRPPPWQRGGGSQAQGSKVASENWIYLRWHTNASQCLHMVGNSDPIFSCSTRLLQMVSVVSKQELLASAFTTAILCSGLPLAQFYAAASHKMLGNQGCAQLWQL